jgi:hypothetical protein
LNNVFGEACTLGRSSKDRSYRKLECLTGSLANATMEEM